MNKPQKTVEIPTFDTIEKLMSDAFLLKCLDKMITKIISDRNKISEGGTIKLKRNAATFLIETNRFNSQSISAEYILIHNKRSVLSSAIRQFIQFLVTECVGKTFKHYDVLFKKKNKITSKSNKS